MCVRVRVNLCMCIYNSTTFIILIIIILLIIVIIIMIAFTMEGEFQEPHRDAPVYVCLVAPQIQCLARCHTVQRRCPLHPLLRCSSRATLDSVSSRYPKSGRRVNNNEYY